MKIGPAWRRHSISSRVTDGGSRNFRNNLKNRKMKSGKTPRAIPGMGSKRSGARQDGNFGGCGMNLRPHSSRSSTHRPKRGRESSQSSVGLSTKSEANSDDSSATAGDSAGRQPQIQPRKRGFLMPNRSFQST